MTQTEELVSRMKLDDVQFQQGTLKMLATQENAAAKTKAIWAEADRTRNLEYKAAVEAMIATEEKFKLAKISIGQQIAVANKEALAKAAADEKVAAEARIEIYTKFAGAKKLIDAQIAASSAAAANAPGIGTSATPENMAGGAALKNFEAGAEMVGGGYIFSKAGKLLGKVGANGEIAKISEGAFKGAAHAVEEGVGTQAKAEAMVLVRETLRGAGISRIIASAMRLASLIFDAAMYYIGIAAVTVGLVDEVLPRAWGGTTISGWWKSRQATKASGKDLKTDQKDTAEMLQQRIRLMQEKGLITDSRGRRFSDDLKNPTQESLMAAFDATNPLMNQLKSSQIQDANWKTWRASLMTGFDKWNNDSLRLHNLLEKINDLKKGSVAYDKTMKDIQETQLAIAKDKVEMAKEEAAAKKKQLHEQTEEEKKAAEKKKRDLNEINELNKQLYNNERERTKTLSELQGEETMGIPSLDEAAGGWGFLTRLKKRYERMNLGGKFSPLRKLARDYERQRYGMGYDFENWSWNQTDKDKATYGDWLQTQQGIGEERYLKQLAAPLQALGIVKNDDLGGKLDELKAVQQQILDKATRDGLKVQIPSN